MTDETTKASKSDSERIEIHELKIDGKPIGEYALSFYEDTKFVGIGNLQINSEYRRKGYATEIIERLKKRYIKDYNLLYCFVEKTNEPALKLYRKTGRISKTTNDKGAYYVEFFKKDDCESEEDGQD